MPIHEKNPLDPQGGTETPQSVFLSRRKWLVQMGLGAGLAGTGYWWWSNSSGGDDEVIEAGRSELHRLPQLLKHYPAAGDSRFEYGRAETARHEAARYTNFYEFSRFKSCWRHVAPFKPYPWELVVDGLCEQPLKIDLDALHLRYADAMCERQYRHRCVERWAMAAPWSGFPLHRLLQDVRPTAEAKYVRFISFNRPAEAGNQGGSEFPWPYVEGLRLDEAMNELTFVATGVYGEPLLKQHGAPLRIVLPWKYGYKSPKSVQRIELTAERPKTFWTSLNPSAYPFESNVDPGDFRPWPQRVERMLGTDESFPTQKYNGYEAWVADLYS